MKHTIINQFSVEKHIAKPSVLSMHHTNKFIIAQNKPSTTSVANTDKPQLNTTVIIGSVSRMIQPNSDANSENKLN